MTRVSTVVLDKEAVQALIDPNHPKHRRVLAVLEAVAPRNLRRAATVRLLVPTAIRVEAGWDRRAAGAAVVNRSRAEDVPLDRPRADRAAAVVRAMAVSVADAHLAVVVESATPPVAVLTSDVSDVRRIAAQLQIDLRVVAL